MWCRGEEPHRHRHRRPQRRGLEGQKKELAEAADVGTDAAADIEDPCPVEVDETTDHLESPILAVAPREARSAALDRCRGRLLGPFVRCALAVWR